MIVDKFLIRQYLDELHISTRIDEDGDILIVQSADDDFGYDVMIYIMINDGCMTYIAGANGYEPMGNLYELANDHNCRVRTPTAVVRDGKIRMECSYFLDEEVSKEYIIENCIKLPIASIWQAFVHFEK